jgi:hypothetical protein
MLGGAEAGKRVPPGEAAKEVTLVLTDVQVSMRRAFANLRGTAQHKQQQNISLCSSPLVGWSVHCIRAILQVYV